MYRFLSYMGLTLIALGVLAQTLSLAASLVVNLSLLGIVVTIIAMIWKIRSEE